MKKTDVKRVQKIFDYIRKGKSPREIQARFHLTQHQVAAYFSNERQGVFNY